MSVEMLERSYSFAIDDLNDEGLKPAGGGGGFVRRRSRSPPMRVVHSELPRLMLNLTSTAPPFANQSTQRRLRWPEAAADQDCAVPHSTKIGAGSRKTRLIPANADLACAHNPAAGGSMWSRSTRAGPADSTQVRYALPLFDSKLPVYPDTSAGYAKLVAQPDTIPLGAILCLVGAGMFCAIGSVLRGELDHGERSELGEPLEDRGDRAAHRLIGVDQDLALLLTPNQPDRSALRSSPRAALLRIPPSRRARTTCSSASDIVRFSPSRSQSLNEPG